MTSPAVLPCRKRDSVRICPKCSTEINEHIHCEVIEGDGAACVRLCACPACGHRCCSEYRRPQAAG